MKRFAIGMIATASIFCGPGCFTKADRVRHSMQGSIRAQDRNMRSMMREAERATKKLKFEEVVE